MIVLDTSIVITALPSIHRTLHFSATSLSWVQNAYTLTFGGLLLLGARAGDLLGRRRLFSVGIALFTLASIAGGLAPSAGVLLAARARPGRRRRDRRARRARAPDHRLPRGPERTRAIALYSAVAGAGGSVGLVLGGMLTEWASWRWGLFINVPVGAALALARAARPARDRASHRPLRPPGRADLDARHDRARLRLRARGGRRLERPVHGRLVRRERRPARRCSSSTERRAAQPITPLRLFASRERSGAYVARMLVVGGMFGMFFFVTQFLQGVLALQPASRRPRLPADDAGPVRDRAARAADRSARRASCAWSQRRRRARARRDGLAQPAVGIGALLPAARDPDGAPRRRHRYGADAADRRSGSAASRRRTPAPPPASSTSRSRSARRSASASW